MFGVSLPELAVIVVVFLVVVGPEKLPDTARKIGQTLGKLKKGSDSIRREFYNSIYTPATELRGDIRKELRTVQADAAAALKINPITEPNTTENSK